MKTKQTTFKREWLDYYLALNGKTYRQLSDFMHIAPWSMIRKRNGQIGWWYCEVRMVKEFLQLTDKQVLQIFPL